MWLFILNSALLGVGLAMDAFSVSVANGLAEPGMRRLKTLGVAGVYSFFQFLMPIVGWLLVRTVVGWFGVIEKFIPYIALGLLLFIGIKMIVECLRGHADEETRRLTLPLLLLQGIATAIDALSVGFTIASCANIISRVAGPTLPSIFSSLCARWKPYTAVRVPRPNTPSILPR